jgi:hypothetical protein
MNKQCIVNFACNGRENYIKGSERMVKSAIDSGLSDTDFLLYLPEVEQSNVIKTVNNNEVFIFNRFPQSAEFGVCPQHKDAPYAFKSYAIQEAIDKGYERIMWLDSSIVITRNINHYLKLLEEVGVILFDNPGCPEATWTSDECLEIMGCSNDLAKTFFQIDAAIMLFDFTTKKANEFFNEYFKYCRESKCLQDYKVSCREEFRAHRHDQAVGSYIGRIKHYINPLNYGAWCYWHEFANGSFSATFTKTGIQIPSDDIFRIIKERLNGRN